MMIKRAGPSFETASVETAEAAPSSPLAEEVTRLFDRWREPLLGYLVTLGLRIHEGEDVTQEVFLSLFQHLLGGKSRENLRAWIFRVGHNLALKRRYSPQRLFLVQAEQDTPVEIQDSAPDPEQTFATKQRRECLLAVVNAISERDRCCLHLRAEGLRYRDIADVLGISLGSVAASLTRSLERLRRVDGR
jgi:RNA polymerase sigma-70 factor (ECF subfamily)